MYLRKAIFTDFTDHMDTVLSEVKRAKVVYKCEACFEMLSGST